MEGRYALLALLVLAAPVAGQGQPPDLAAAVNRYVNGGGENWKRDEEESTLQRIRRGDAKPALPSPAPGRTRARTVRLAAILGQPIDFAGVLKDSDSNLVAPELLNTPNRETFAALMAYMAKEPPHAPGVAPLWKALEASDICVEARWRMSEFLQRWLREQNERKEAAARVVRTQLASDETEGGKLAAAIEKARRATWGDAADVWRGNNVRAFDVVVGRVDWAVGNQFMRGYARLSWAELAALESTDHMAAVRFLMVDNAGLYVSCGGWRLEVEADGEVTIPCGDDSIIPAGRLKTGVWHTAEFRVTMANPARRERTLSIWLNGREIPGAEKLRCNGQLEPVSVVAQDGTNLSVGGVAVGPSRKADHAKPGR